MFKASQIILSMGRGTKRCFPSENKVFPCNKVCPSTQIYVIKKHLISSMNIT